MKKQGSKKVLFIGDDMILLNNLICRILADKKISIIFASSWNEGMKYMKNNNIKLIILDCGLISKLKPSHVMPLIKKSKIPVFLINTTDNMWIYRVVEGIKDVPVMIYKRPLIMDRFFKAVYKLLKK